MQVVSFLVRVPSPPSLLWKKGLWKEEILQVSEKWSGPRSSYHSHPVSTSWGAAVLPSPHLYQGCPHQLSQMTNEANVQN